MADPDTASPARDANPDDKVTLSIQVSPALKARLTNAADERMMAVSVIAARALESFLDDLVPVAELALTRSQAAGRPATPRVAGE